MEDKFEKGKYTVTGSVYKTRVGAKEWNSVTIRVRVQGAKEAGMQFDTSFITVMTKDDISPIGEGDVVGVVGSLSLSAYKDKVQTTIFAKELDIIKKGTPKKQDDDLPW